MAQTLTELIDQRIESLTLRLNTCNDRIAEIKQLEPTSDLLKELGRVLHNKRLISEELEDWTSLK